MPPPVHTLRRASHLRRNLTPPEARLWSCLKAKSVAGYRFRRQHPIGPYILDFYCPAARLAVEVDGALHDFPDQQAHDERRTQWLKHQGIRVLRIRATDVRDYLSGVLDLIEQEVSRGVCKGSPSTTSWSPSPSRWEGNHFSSLWRSHGEVAQSRQAL
jgi:very-short-patch-repair endonuclease